MLDPIVDVYIAQVEAIGPVVSVQDASDGVRNEEAESRSEVVGALQRGIQFFESDVATGVG